SNYKDLWPKYKNLQCYKQRFKNVFECQGLWVDVEFEKDLDFHKKQAIEEYGVAKFVEKCKERVLKYSAIQTGQSKRLGYFADWDHSYFTMSDENNYMIWHFLKVCHENGWIYKGHESVPWCPRCRTAISQHEMLTEDYKEVVHKAIVLKLPIQGRKNEYLLVWTTTPWTIPANIAVAVDVKLDYSLVEGNTGDKFWVAKDAMERIFKTDFKSVLKTVKGKELVGLKYTGPFDELPAATKVKTTSPAFHTVVATDSLIMPINTTEGTGLVHTAVSAGTEDFKLGKLRGLPIIPVIDDEANYLPGLGSLEGKNAKKHPELILDHLQERDAKEENWVFSLENYKHRYPGCWRCKTELVWKIADEWYIAMDKKGTDGRTLRSRMQTVAKIIKWLPEFGLERELDWLTNMHDWLISKPNRYWGLALPIYECSCGHFQVIGNKAELKTKAVEGWDKFDGLSPHKPQIDQVKITCEKCHKKVSRIPDVGNVWLDAGIIPFSTLLDPKTGLPSFSGDQTYFKKWFPAAFITESFPGQFKNWFYSLIAMSTVLVDTNSFETVLGYASMLAEDGRPMHKSWGNYIDFDEGAKKIGVDIIRWLYCRQNPVNNLLFGYKSTDELRRRFHLILWNSYRFFANSAVEMNWDATEKISSAHVLDRWILSRFSSTLKATTTALDNYDAYHATQALEEFVSDLSTWYIRRSRERVSEALPTLYYILKNLSIVLSIFMPYLSDRIYTNLTGEESVHLSSWPELDPSKIDLELENNMALARKIVELGHSKRKELSLRVRQPLASASITGPVLSPKIQEVICSELNVKVLRFSQGENLEITFDTKLTPELVAEGKARDLIRDLQEARKLAGFTPNQPVIAELPDWPSTFEDIIKEKVNASSIKKGESLKVYEASS
ncbi:MAG: class I tRNA ligase family protein, partial [bacterium]